MGCFPIKQGRNSAKHSLSSVSSSSSLRIVKELKIGGLSSHLNNCCMNSGRSKGITHYHNAPPGVATTYTRARAALRNASSKFVRPQTRSLSSTSFSKAQSYAADGKRTRGYGLGEMRSIRSPFAPITTSDNEREGIASSGHLFPLPLPPSAISLSTASEVISSASEVISTPSVSSTSSESSSSAPFSGCAISSFSQNRKSYDNPLGAISAKRSNPLDLKKEFSSCAQPLPLPPASAMGSTLREFSYDELAGACLNFAQGFFIRDGGAGPVFKAMVRRDVDVESAVEIAVTRLSRGHLHSFRKWRAELGTLARLSHPNICKVVGFSRDIPSTVSDKLAFIQRERLLVYEHTSNGSLDSLLYGRKGRAPLDWSTRAKIALGAAEGLAFLHERAPRQIVYKSFKTLNIQVDHNFNAKLSDYAFAKTPRELPCESPARFLPLDDAYAAPETKSYNEVTAKSNVWSFGILLLELLTGRQNMDDYFAAEERDLLQWCRPYLLDPKRLYLVMDPELKGRYLTRKAKMVADLALQCLIEDPEARPSMRDVATCLLWHMPRSDPSNQTFNTNEFHSPGNGYIGNGNSSIKSKYSKSYSLASILASPARSFATNSHSNSPYHSPARSSRTRFRGFLSEEITRESARSLAGSGGGGDYHPFLSRSLFLSGEIRVNTREPRMHRSLYQN